jgi:hypothetical protein
MKVSIDPAAIVDVQVPRVLEWLAAQDRAIAIETTETERMQTATATTSAQAKATAAAAHRRRASVELAVPLGSSPVGPRLDPLFLARGRLLRLFLGWHV